VLVGASWIGSPCPPDVLVPFVLAMLYLIGGKTTTAVSAALPASQRKWGESTNEVPPRRGS